MRFMILASMAVCALAAVRDTALAIRSEHDTLELRREHRRLEARSCKAKASTHHLKASGKHHHHSHHRAFDAIASPTRADHSKSTHKKSQTTTKKHHKATGKSTSSGKADSAHTLVNLASIGAFHGKNGPGIASWYDADTSRDSTNGHSWCGFPYLNSSPVFAPSVNTMMAAAGGDYNKAIEMFCGLEARVTGPNGESALMYIGDGFDDAWIREKGSIDIMQDTWEKWAGKQTNDKNVVIQGTTWQLTGRRSKQYVAKGRGL